jgi:hydroxymethylglutaryl-CoA reductase
MSREERIKFLLSECGLSGDDVNALQKGLGIEDAERLTENVVGTHSLPLGIAANFRINGKDYLIPMAIEESSVVAAASHAAKLARASGGFKAKCDKMLTVGLIQLKVPKPSAARSLLLKKKREIMRRADEAAPQMTERGGGARDIGVKVVETRRGKFVVVYIYFDCIDAMGANTINTVCEKVAPWLSDITGGTHLLKIISNYAAEKVARATAVWKKEEIGEETIDRILDAAALAQNDIRRTATHNKGIMNGIDAVVIATGNDWRAVEAGAHSYAARTRKYKSLTEYWKDKKGNLVGSIEIPIQIGTVGGITTIHPTARISLKILGVKTAKELAEVMASVGLAQNFAALRALAGEGIQKGHMKLHAINLAMAAGAKGEVAEKIAAKMIAEGKITMERAAEILLGMKR